eukprot:1137270-Pelagomonas_calceolata.AAC.1
MFPSHITGGMPAGWLQDLVFKGPHSVLRVLRTTYLPLDISLPGGYELEDSAAEAYDVAALKSKGCKVCVLCVYECVCVTAHSGV